MAKLKEQKRLWIVPGYVNINQYNNFDGSSFERYCAELRRANKKLIRDMWPSKDASWMLVTVMGKIVEYGEGKLIPSFHQTRVCAGQVGEQIYRLTRPSLTYFDTAFFMQGKTAVVAANLFKREADEFDCYLQPVEDIKIIAAQSGLIDKLRKDGTFALGKMKSYNPKGHVSGTTVVDVSHAREGYETDVLVFIASENKDKVHARGSKVEGERTESVGGKKMIRIERLHRYDDPVLDILDTWQSGTEISNVRPLILYGPRDVWDNRTLPLLEKRRTN